MATTPEVAGGDELERLEAPMGREEAYLLAATACPLIAAAV